MLLICLMLMSGASALGSTAVPYVECTADTWLYSESGEKIFQIPTSYYARINNLDDLYYYVTFNGVAGKINKNEVSSLGYEGTAKGTSLEIRTSEKYADFTEIQLKERPDGSSKTLTSIPYEEEYTFLGKYPTEWGEIFYCVRYSGLIGYVKSERTSEPDLTIEPFIPEASPPKTQSGAQTPTTPFDDLELKIIVILGIAIPAVGIVVLIFARKR